MIEIIIIYLFLIHLPKKDKYNGIILFIHGGSWLFGEKENIQYLTVRYAKCGYITAEMNHTFLYEKYEDFSMFRILDEITACIESIKEVLINKGFDVNKLELGIYGFSSGAHIVLLYGYSIKNIPLPLKFILNSFGPVTLEPQYFYKFKNKESILDSIEPKDIEKAFKEQKLIKVIGNEFPFVRLMNRFIGLKYSMEEIEEMLDEKSRTIKKDNEKYLKLLSVAKFTFPITFVNGRKAPTLCQYGGKDYIIGVMHYSLLKKLSEKYGNKLVLIYTKYDDHDSSNYEDEDSKFTMRELHYQILNFAETYFTSK